MASVENRMEQLSCLACEYCEVTINGYNEKWICTHIASFGQTIGTSEEDTIRCENYLKHGGFADGKHSTNG